MLPVNLFDINPIKFFCKKSPELQMLYTVSIDTV